MTLPALLGDRLAIPAIVAPMFLVSGPDLVVECCKAGLLGTFPVLNQRSSEGYGEWLDEIEGRLAGKRGLRPSVSISSFTKAIPGSRLIWS